MRESEGEHDDRLTRTVERVCAAALDATPVAVRVPPTGNSKRTALTTLADGREVVVQYVRTGVARESGRADGAASDRDGGGDRGAGWADGAHRLAAEAAVTRAVADRTPVPVAGLLADGTLAEPPVSYLVAERVAGADLHERFTALPEGARASLARTLGRYLAAVHEAFRFDAPGRVGVAGGGLAVTSPLPAGAFYAEYLADGLAAWPDALSDLAPRVRDALDGRLDDLPADPRLFPWDYRPGNVVVGGEGGERTGDGRTARDDGGTTPSAVDDGPAAGPTPVVAGVLDWGDPLAAHPGLSAAKAEFTLADWYVEGDADVAALRGAFRDGYRSVRPFPDAHYEAFRLLGIVASAADAQGRVTRPRYPVVDKGTAVAFHRQRILATVERLD